VKAKPLRRSDGGRAARTVCLAFAALSRDIAEFTPALGAVWQCFGLVNEDLTNKPLFVQTRVTCDGVLPRRSGAPN